MPELRLMLPSLLRADVTVVVKNLRSLVVGLAMGLLLIVSTRSVQNARAYGGHAYAVSLATALVLMTMAILGYAMSIARDRESGVLKRLQVTPAPGWAIIGSRMVAQAMSGLVSAFVIVAVGSGVDSLSLSVTQYGLLLAFSALGMVVFLSIGQALVGLVRSASTVNATSRSVYVVLAVFGLLGETRAVRGVWRAVAPWTPLGAVMTLYERVLDVSAWGTRDTESLLACAGYVLVLAWLGVRCFRWEPR